MFLVIWILLLTLKDLAIVHDRINLYTQEELSFE